MYSRGFSDLLIEIDHVESLRILKPQNFEEASTESLVKAIQALNACNPLFPSDHVPLYKVYPILEERNQVARFAPIGMLG